jgi:hypothetical protein
MRHILHRSYILIKGSSADHWLMRPPSSTNHFRNPRTCLTGSHLEVVGGVGNIQCCFNVQDPVEYGNPRSVSEPFSMKVTHMHLADTRKHRSCLLFKNQLLSHMDLHGYQSNFSHHFICVA